MTGHLLGDRQSPPERPTRTVSAGTSHGLVRLSRGWVPEAADVLARSLQHAPDMTFVFGSDRATIGPAALRLYEAVIRVGLYYGRVYTTPALDGVAVWVAPRSTRFTIGNLLRTGFLGAVLRMGPRPLTRFVRGAAITNAIHARAVEEPHWVLVYLGVVASERNRRIGARLLHPVLAEADADGVACYVESADERNLTFYLRQGFEVVEHREAAGGFPAIWAMVRPPQ